MRSISFCDKPRASNHTADARQLFQKSILRRFSDMELNIIYTTVSAVEESLQEARQNYSRYCDKVQRVYLVGADPFALSAKKLLERIELIKQYLPNAGGVTLYSRTDNIGSKSDDELKALTMSRKT